jgi:hypothetical protein
VGRGIAREGLTMTSARIEIRPFDCPFHPS